MNSAADGTTGAGRPKRIVKVFGQSELVGGRFGERPDGRPGQVHEHDGDPDRHFGDRRRRLLQMIADGDGRRGVIGQHAQHGGLRAVERANVRVQHPYVHAVRNGRARVMMFGRRLLLWCRRGRFDDDERCPPGHVRVAETGYQGAFVIPDRRHRL